MCWTELTCKKCQVWLFFVHVTMTSSVMKQQISLVYQPWVLRCFVSGIPVPLSLLYSFINQWTANISQEWLAWSSNSKNYPVPFSVSFPSSLIWIWVVLIFKIREQTDHHPNQTAMLFSSTIKVCFFFVVFISPHVKTIMFVCYNMRYLCIPPVYL